MDHNLVQLIGVFDPDGKDEGFCYTVNAPTNLWMSALTEDGSRMGHQFMAYALNELLDEDCFEEGKGVSITDQSDTTLVFTVGEEVTAQHPHIQANMADTETVRVVNVTIAKAKESVSNE